VNSSLEGVGRFPYIGKFYVSALSSSMPLRKDIPKKNLTGSSRYHSRHVVTALIPKHHFTASKTGLPALLIREIDETLHLLDTLHHVLVLCSVYKFQHYRSHRRHNPGFAATWE
jgi:hypothetical protein